METNRKNNKDIKEPKKLTPENVAKAFRDAHKFTPSEELFQRNSLGHTQEYPSQISYDEER